MFKVNWIRKTAYSIAVSLLLTTMGVAAETNQSAKETATQHSESATLQKTPVAHFPETSHEFEPVVEGIKVTHDFIVQNKGTAPLAIKKVRTG